MCAPELFVNPCDNDEWGSPLDVCRPLDPALPGFLFVLSYAACFQAAIELVCGNVVECRQLLTRAMDRVVNAGQRYSSAGAVVATISGAARLAAGAASC